MDSFLINNKICSVNIVPYEDKCGLRDDGTYLICYSGWRFHFHYDDKEILNASISEESPELVSFKRNPFHTFGKDIARVKEYLQEKHEILQFEYLDEEDYYVKF